MVAGEQDFPFGPFTPEPAPDTLAAVLDRYAAAGAPEGIGPAIDRIGQNMVDRVVDRELLGDTTAVYSRVFDRRQLDSLPPHPEMHLPDTLELRELPEHQIDGFTYLQVRIFFNPVVPHLHVTDCDGQEQFAASRLLLQRYPKASDISSPPCLLRLLPAGAVAGWDLHPLESAAFSWRTPKEDIQCLPLNAPLRL